MDDRHSAVKCVFRKGGNNHMSIKYTFISTDGAKCDIVTVSKDLLQNATMSAEKFDELVLTFRKENVTLTEAYYRAEEIHEEYFGRPRYSDVGSYKVSYSYRHKRHGSRKDPL